MPELVLLRHGQSLWNEEGRFTGWMDIDLSSNGKEEARAAGRLLKACGYSFDVAYTSDRVLPLWHEKIAPDLNRGKRVIISSHGNTIRARIKHIDSISDKGIENVEMPTGIPLVYELDCNNRPLESFFILDPDCRKNDLAR